MPVPVPNMSMKNAVVPMPLTYRIFMPCFSNSAFSLPGTYLTALRRMSTPT